ncbi:AraC family transcriptional regulator [Tahibacter sp.]|uniref:AraC family transcriptional regulator n=1 Tax=Tahibacter sp. TaxID=2056211 RepID=UPI0028C41C4B|nr:AraC family transcriptional regulator [Tahibacter sp.]
MLTAPTAAALCPYVEGFWARAAQAAPAARERVLPSGRMHVAVRLDGEGLRLYADAADTRGWLVANAVVAGSRDRPYFKDTSQPSRSVGALLRPGAAPALFGCRADALSNRHVALEALCGDAATQLRQDLSTETDEQRQIATLQAFLLGQLRPIRALHTPIAQALAALRSGDVGRLVEAIGCSHRYFIAQFRANAGFAPKRYTRLLRLQQVLAAGNPSASWRDAALAAGYSDQAHFNREFREFTGLTPQAWRAAASASAHHVACATAPVNSVQDGRRRDA